MIFDVIKTYIQFQEEVLCCSRLQIIPCMLKNWVLFSNLDNSRYVLIICVYDIELLAVLLAITMMYISISRLDGMMPAFGSALRCLNSPFPTKINVQPNVMRIIRKLRTSSAFKNR